MNSITEQTVLIGRILRIPTRVELRALDGPKWASAEVIKDIPHRGAVVTFMCFGDDGLLLCATNTLSVDTLPQRQA